MFDPGRGCDGRGGESDINPAHGTFTDAELVITIWSGRRPGLLPSAAHGTRTAAA
jgi:hypothetical protein